MQNHPFPVVTDHFSREYTRKEPLPGPSSTPFSRGPHVALGLASHTLPHGACPAAPKRSPGSVGAIPPGPHKTWLGNWNSDLSLWSWIGNKVGQQQTPRVHLFCVISRPWGLW